MNNQELRLPPEHEEKITGWLNRVKFRKRIFGGISETDVWKKISELNDMYREALIAERARCDALIADREAKASAEIATAQKAAAEKAKAEDRAEQRETADRKEGEAE